MQCFTVFNTVFLAPIFIKASYIVIQRGDNQDFLMWIHPLIWRREIKGCNILNLGIMSSALGWLFSVFRSGDFLLLRIQIGQ